MQKDVSGDTMTNTSKQHSQRCETCKHYLKHAIACKAINERLINGADEWIAKVGCASHSSAAAPAPSGTQELISALAGMCTAYERVLNHLSGGSDAAFTPSSEYKKAKSILILAASRPVPASGSEPDGKYCDGCRFVKDCTLLYIPPCARRMQQRASEAAAAERERVLEEIRKECMRDESVGVTVFRIIQSLREGGGA